MLRQRHAVLWLDLNKEACGTGHLQTEGVQPIPQKTKGGGMERDPGDGATEREPAKADLFGEFSIM